MSARINYGIIGKRFGRLIVTEFVGKHPTNPRITLWKCLCDCGNEKVVRRGNLISTNNNVSCGCLRHEASVAAAKHMGKLNATHGLADSLTYSSWKKMFDRCYNQSHKQFKDYGGRGIAMCGGIKESPEAIISVIGARLDKSMTIDRVDVNGGYWCGQCQECVESQHPKNIRWATRKEQSRNRRNNSYYCIGGRTQMFADWKKALGICNSQFYKRYSHFKVCAPSS